MASYDSLDPDSDPFRPPAIPTLVACLHCGQEYDSYRIEWRVERDADSRPHGFWCCPIPGCSGMGYGFDILPVDPDYQDERGGWIHDDDDDDDDDEYDVEDEESFPDDADPDAPDGGTKPKDKPTGGEEALPW